MEVLEGTLKRFRKAEFDEWGLQEITAIAVSMLVDTTTIITKHNPKE